MPKILIVTTSHGRLGDTGQPTGLWLEELATPYYALADSGAELTLASIKGGPIPIDPKSREPDGSVPASVERFLADPEAVAAARTTPAIGELYAGDYDAIFLPGGHGTMWDLPGNGALARAVGTALNAGRIVAAVCHGPAGLVSAKTDGGRPIVEGKRVATFTDSEERAVGLDRVVPFLLETRLRALGATIEKAPDFQPFAVRDGNLITGQNPASSEQVAELVLEALKEQGVI
jgi:putative intracellular protease/amidase